MILVLFMTSLAHPLEPTPRPERTKPIETDCKEKTPLMAGGSLTCDSIAVPPHLLADLYLDRAWAMKLKEDYLIHTADLEDDIERLQWQVNLLEQMRAQDQEPDPIFQRPGVKVTAGIIIGSATTIGITYAVSQAMR